MIRGMGPHTVLQILRLRASVQRHSPSPHLGRTATGDSVAILTGRWASTRNKRLLHYTVSYQSQSQSQSQNQSQIQGPTRDVVAVRFQHLVPAPPFPLHWRTTSRTNDPKRAKPNPWAPPHVATHTFSDAAHECCLRPRHVSAIHFTAVFVPP